MICRGILLACCSGLDDYIGSGQQQPVLVVNLHARDSFDNAAIDLMMTRVEQIVTEMAPVGSEFNDRFHADISGDVLDNLDFSAVLRSVTSMKIEHTREEIEKAIARAREATKLQNEILTHALSYSPNALQGTLGFTMQHVESFVRGMLSRIGVETESEHHNGSVLEIRLPDNLRDRFPEFFHRTVVRITTNRRLAQRLQNVVLLDFENHFFQYLINQAKSQSFDGIYATVHSPKDAEGMLSAFRLCWQNDQGNALTEEFVTVFRDTQGNLKYNPPFLAEWLLNDPQTSLVPDEDERQRQTIFEDSSKKADKRLANSSSRFKHPNSLVALVAADFRHDHANH